MHDREHSRDEDRRSDTETPSGGPEPGKQPLVSDPGLVVAPASSTWEAEADDVASAVVSGQRWTGGFSQVAGLGQAKHEDADTSPAGVDIPSGSGEELSPETRVPLERGFGASLAHVRIHNDGAAAQAADALGARAFTTGNDIYFNSGEFAPGSPSGDHLLAHEVAHTFQQGASGAVQRKVIQREGKPGEKDAKDAKDADKKEEVDSNWSLEFFPLPGKGDGKPVTKRPTRGPKDSFRAKLKVTPEGKSVQFLEGINAASSGAVSIGSVKHDKDTSGTVSGTGTFGGMGGLTAKVDWGASMKPTEKFKRRAELAEVQKKVDAALKKALETDGSDDAIRAAVTAALPPSSDEVSYELKSIVLVPKSGKGDVAATFDTVSYGPITKNPTKVMVRIDVPYKEMSGEIKTGGSGEKTTDKSEGEGSKDAVETKVDETTKKKETYVKNVRSAVSSVLTSAYQDSKTKINETSHTVAGESSKEVGGELGGEVGGTATVAGKEISLDILPGIGKLAKWLKLLPKIDVSIGASGKVNGKLSGKYGTKTTDTTSDKETLTSTEMSSVESTFTSQIEESISNTVETETAKQVGVTIRSEKSKDKKEGETVKSGWEVSTTTGDVNYELQTPRLVVSAS